MEAILKDKYWLESGNAYADDVKRLRKVCFSNGYQISLSECYSTWFTYSRARSSQWITVPKKDSEIWDIIYNEIL